MASTIRSFIAIELPQEHCRALQRVVRQLARDWPQYRWGSTDQLHLTVNFLGDVRDDRIPQVCEQVRDVAARHTDFELSFSTLGAFPKTSRPRILWAGIEQGQSEMSQIHYQIAEALQDLCREQDRKRFSPHVTLGRIRRNQRWPDEMISLLEQAEPLQVPPLCVSHLTVFASHLETTGPVYTVMDQAQLG